MTGTPAARAISAVPLAVSPVPVAFPKMEERTGSGSEAMVIDFSRF